MLEHLYFRIVWLWVKFKSISKRILKRDLKWLLNKRKTKEKKRTWSLATLEPSSSPSVWPSALPSSLGLPCPSRLRPSSPQDGPSAQQPSKASPSFSFYANPAPLVSTFPLLLPWAVSEPDTNPTLTLPQSLVSRDSMPYMLNQSLPQGRDLPLDSPFHLNAWEPLLSVWHCRFRSHRWAPRPAAVTFLPCCI